MDFHLHEIEDILSGLPRMDSFDFQKKYDLIICTLGFEERTYKLFSELAKHSNLKESTIIIIKYPTNKEDNEKNLPEFEKLRDKVKSIEILEYSREGIFNKFIGLLKGFILFKGQEVLFDVSTCSSYVFYPVIKVLFGCEIKLTIGYVEAEIYFPKQEEWNAISEKAEKEDRLFPEAFENAGFQSLGVEDIYPCALFSEANPGNFPNQFVAVPNFSPVRMSSMIARDKEINGTSPDNCFWLIGNPPSNENSWRAEALKRTNNLGQIQKIKHVDTLNYLEILKALEGIWVESKFKFHMTIGNLGSKMQHLGTFFFLNLHPDVGLWLAEPKEFQAKRFSEGSKKVWKIELNDTHEIKSLLEKYLTFRWEF